MNDSPVLLRAMGRKSKCFKKFDKLQGVSSPGLAGLSCFVKFLLSLFAGFFACHITIIEGSFKEWTKVRVVNNSRPIKGTILSRVRIVLTEDDVEPLFQWLLGGLLLCSIGLKDSVKGTLMYP